MIVALVHSLDFAPPLDPVYLLGVVHLTGLASSMVVAVGRDLGSIQVAALNLDLVDTVVAALTVDRARAMGVVPA